MNHRESIERYLERVGQDITRQRQPKQSGFPVATGTPEWTYRLINYDEDHFNGKLQKINPDRPDKTKLEYIDVPGRDAEALLEKQGWTIIPKNISEDDNVTDVYVTVKKEAGLLVFNMPLPKFPHKGNILGIYPAAEGAEKTLLGADPLFAGDPDEEP